MIQIHFVDYLGYWSAHDTALYSIAEWFGMIPAPFFTFLVGISLFISLSKYPPAVARRQIFRRGVGIFVLGLLHNLFNWGADLIFDWDILTLIGSALIIVYFLRRVNLTWLSLIIFSIIILSPILRELSNYNQYWNFADSEFIYALTFKDVFLGWLLNGYFPIFPWIIFPLAGYATGRTILGASASDKQRKYARNFGLLGVLLALVGALGVFFYPLTNLDVYLSPILFYPASTTYLLIMLGATLIAFTGLWLLLDAKKTSTARTKWTRGRLALPIQRYSRYSLSTYIIHHTVHLYPLYLVGWLKMGDRWYYYADAMPIWMALLLWLVFVVIFYYVIKQWDKIEGKYSLEWMLGHFVKE
jgi:uncharacterized membrane protein